MGKKIIADRRLGIRLTCQVTRITFPDFSILEIVVMCRQKNTKGVTSRDANPSPRTKSVIELVAELELRRL